MEDTSFIHAYNDLLLFSNSFRPIVSVYLAFICQNMYSKPFQAVSYLITSAMSLFNLATGSSFSALLLLSSRIYKLPVDSNESCFHIKANS